MIDPVMMTTMVCFLAAGTGYCLPVQATRSVRPADDLISLPDPATGVVGMIPGDPPLTVISPLRSEGGHILVLETAGKTFGLLVEEVTGLERVDQDAIRPTPQGQDRQLVIGTLDIDGRLVLVADPDALAERL